MLSGEHAMRRFPFFPRTTKPPASCFCKSSTASYKGYIKSRKFPTLLHTSCSDLHHPDATDAIAAELPDLRLPEGNPEELAAESEGSGAEPPNITTDAQPASATSPRTAVERKSKRKGALFACCGAR